MANNFNWQLRQILQVPNEYVQQNNGRKKLTQAAIQLLRDTLSPNYDVEVADNIITIRQQGELIGHIRQREVHRAIQNEVLPGQPRPRLRYHDVLDLIIEVANQNHRNAVEDAIRQAMHMGPRFNLADLPLEGTPEPPGFGMAGPQDPNHMNLDGGRKRSKSKSKRRHSKKHRKTRRRA